MTGKALAKADEILEDDWRDTNDPDMAGPLLRAQTSVITTVLSTQAKVDEHRLRRVQADRLPDLLKLVDQIASRIPAPEPLKIPTIDIVPE